MSMNNHQPLAETTPGFPRLGEPAPAFEALSTHGPLRLSEMRGRWVLLFSHPADFTPVCSTEFLSLAKLQPEFAARGCRLVGLSVDSIFSHIAWARELEQLGGTKITFPIIADTDMQVARAYGMLHPGVGEAAAVRAVFWIDSEGLLRAMMYYPPTTGRSMTEILRVLEALQMADHENVATPADWQPNDRVIVPVPRTQDAAERRLEEEPDCETWYLCRRKA